MSRKLVFRAVPLLASVVLLEAVLRGLGLPATDLCFVPQADFWVEDPEMGFGYRPGIAAEHYRINERGLRGPLVPLPKPAGTHRLMFVGDSTAFGLGVELHEAFAVQTTERLRQRTPSATLDYVIAALPGYSSHHSRVMVERHVAVEPDVVVLYVGAYNDHGRGRYFRDTQIPERMARRHAWWHQIRVVQLAELFSGVVYRKYLRQFRSRIGQMRVPPDEFEANVERMIQAARTAGARVLIAQPPFSDSLLERHETIPHYQAALERQAETHDVTRVDLHALFATRDPDDVYLPDHFHFNPRGHALVADALADVIARDGLLSE